MFFIRNNFFQIKSSIFLIHLSLHLLNKSLFSSFFLSKSQNVLVSGESSNVNFSNSIDLFSFLFRLFDKISLKNTKIIISKKYKILIYLLFFIPTIIYLLSHYPGVFLNDTLFMLYHPVSEMNPVIYGMFISLLFFSINVFFSSYFISYFFFIFVAFIFIIYI